MKVEVWEKEGAVLLTRSGGESLKISLMEFWEIVKAGDRLDTREEIENYLADCDTIAGISSDAIRGNQAFLDELIDKVIEKRLGNESGDQIYDAICILANDGRNMEELLKEKSLQDMEVEDFKDPVRRRKFNGLQHAQRDLKMRLHEQNRMPFGGDRNMQDFLMVRLGDVTAEMDMLRVKEWMTRQPYDLDVKSAGYQEALEMMEEVCSWYFPELSETVFGSHGGNFRDRDFVFREPGEIVAYDWFYYNPDANAGGQLVCVALTEEDMRRMMGHPDPISVVDSQKVCLEDIDKQGFFITLFDMLQMNKDGWFIGTDIQEVCQEIVGEHCKETPVVAVDSVEQSRWHGDVDVPYGFPGLDAIEDCDSMELAAPEMLRRLLRDGTGFRNISVEQVGHYNNGIGFSFSFDTLLTADKAGSLIQKALNGLKFEACSELVPDVVVEDRITEAVARAGKEAVGDSGEKVFVK